MHTISVNLAMCRNHMHNGERKVREAQKIKKILLALPKNWDVTVISARCRNDNFGSCTCPAELTDVEPVVVYLCVPQMKPFRKLNTYSLHSYLYVLQLFLL
jgi:hypothetical protein